MADAQELWTQLEKLGDIERDTTDLEGMEHGPEKLVARAVERAGLRITLALIAHERFIPQKTS